MSQISLERKTSLSIEDVLEKAKKTFIEEHGMSLEEDSACCLRFEAGGGFVYIRVSEEEARTKVEVKSREWADISKDFIKKL
jgi:hypothetical protein